jgi:hypothetical protein
VEAGANALELNVHYLATDPAEESAAGARQQEPREVARSSVSSRADTMRILQSWRAG